jgi:hypothetical protein
VLWVNSFTVKPSGLVEWPRSCVIHDFSSFAPPQVWGNPYGFYLTGILVPQRVLSETRHGRGSPSQPRAARSRARNELSPDNN